MSVYRAPTLYNSVDVREACVFTNSSSAAVVRAYNDNVAENSDRLRIQAFILKCVPHFGDPDRAAVPLYSKFQNFFKRDPVDPQRYKYNRYHLLKTMINLQDVTYKEYEECAAKKLFELDSRPRNDWVFMFDRLFVEYLYARIGNDVRVIDALGTLANAPTKRSLLNPPLCIETTFGPHDTIPINGG